MLRATSVVRKAAVKADRVIETLTLDHEDRGRRRLALKGDSGLDILLDLDKPTALADGDAVKLEDGRLVLIRAAAQSLLEIRADNPLRLMRVAWHIGNRHTPAEITADALYIENDHVLAEMVRGQGCAMAVVERPFQPERGAYDHGQDHAGHDHAGNDHAGHDHHGHDHHAHGADCGCGHDHSHDDHKHDHGHQAHASAGHDHAHGHEHHDHGHKHGAEHGPKGHVHDH